MPLLKRVHLTLPTRPFQIASRDFVDVRTWLKRDGAIYVAGYSVECVCFFSCSWTFLLFALAFAAAAAIAAVAAAV